MQTVHTHTEKAAYQQPNETDLSGSEQARYPTQPLPRLEYAKGSVLQRQMANPSPPSPIRPVENSHSAGLPGKLKNGIEALSGYNMDSVNVHYNSSKPAQVMADAYAQGSNIYLGRGQEQHLPHEAWHVVQQAQGRVSATMQFAGRNINNEKALEQEADRKGQQAMALGDNLSRSPIEQLAQPDFNLQWQTSTPNPTSIEALSPVVQLSRHDSIIQCSFKTEYEGNFRRAGEMYEEDLGLYTYNFPDAEAAANQALGGLRNIMGVNDNADYARVFGVSNVRSAGAVGTVADTVRNAVDNGNLREKMTAFYNASLGPFKRKLEQAWLADDVALAVNNLNVPQAGKDNINQRKEQIDSLAGRVKYDVLSNSLQQKLRDVYIAPADPFFRNADEDDLTRSQKGVITTAARTNKIDSNNDDELNALTISHLADFDFSNDLLADLDHSASFGNFFDTSKFVDARNALQELNAENGSQAARLKKFRTLQSKVWKWLDANPIGGTAEQQQVYQQQLHNGNTKTEKIAAVAGVLKKHLALTLLKNELSKIMSTSQRTPAQLRNNRSAFNADLSVREQDHIRAQLPAYDNAGAYRNNLRLPWAEGGSLFSTTAKNAWTKEARDVLLMPVRSGPSGTTDRMFQATNYLGLTAEQFKLNFRLALLGWMLTSNDHSYHEIMGVSKTYGLPYEPGLTGYNFVAPLTEQQLRTNACLIPHYLHLFPDEVAYYQSIENDHSQLLSPNWQDDRAVAADNPLARHENGGITPNQFAQRGLPFLNRNIAAYTATTVSFINLYLKNPLTAKQRFSFLLSNRNNNFLMPQNSWGKQVARDTMNMFPDATGKSVHEEMSYHTNFLNRAWQKLPVYQGVSWRGGGASKLYEVGDTFSPSEYWSSTKLANPTATIEGYANRSGGSVRMLFAINGQTGRIVNGASVNEPDDVRNRNIDINTGLPHAPELDEVLFQPNTRFRVTAVLNAGHLGGNANFPVVDVDEE